MTTLHFEQMSAFKHVFQILYNGKKVGALEYTSSAHGQADGIMKGQTWHFTEKGILNLRVLVMNQANEQVALYAKPFLKRKGTVMIDGRQFGFKPKGLGLKSRYVWTDDAGHEIIAYAQGGLWKLKGDIEIRQELSKQIAVLVPLGMFIGLNRDEDSAVAAT